MITQHPPLVDKMVNKKKKKEKRDKPSIELLIQQVVVAAAATTKKVQLCNQGVGEGEEGEGSFSLL